MHQLLSSTYSNFCNSIGRNVGLRYLSQPNESVQRNEIRVHLRQTSKVRIQEQVTMGWINLQCNCSSAANTHMHAFFTQWGRSKAALLSQRVGWGNSQDTGGYSWCNGSSHSTLPVSASIPAEAVPPLLCPWTTGTQRRCLACRDPGRAQQAAKVPVRDPLRAEASARAGRPSGQRHPAEGSGARAKAPPARPVALRLPGPPKKPPCAASRLASNPHV